MIDFIICDDNALIRKNVKSVVSKLMMKSKTEYKIHLFKDYDDNFMNEINKMDTNKIYILDIETPTRSGIDIARKIRDKDKQSTIIFLTSHDELGYTVLKSRLNFLTFISKYDDYEVNIEEAIIEALEYVGIKRTLEFNEFGVSYNIPLDNILYITKDTFDRKTIIVTEYNEFRVYYALNKILKELEDADFVQSHRSCVVNMRRVESVNFNKRIITFDNGYTIDMISDTYKKELVR